MIGPGSAMMMAGARQADFRREAERFAVARRDESCHRRCRHRSIADSPSERKLLLPRVHELIELSDRLGCGREELVRMIERLS